MIAKLYVYRKCESQNIVKNGHNASGSQQYKCKDCGAHGVLEPALCRRTRQIVAHVIGDRSVKTCRKL